MPNAGKPLFLTAPFLSQFRCVLRVPSRAHAPGRDELAVLEDSENQAADLAEGACAVVVADDHEFLAFFAFELQPVLMLSAAPYYHDTSDSVGS